MTPRYFILQWHVTAECDYHCRHCYMLNEPSYSSEINNVLSFENCQKIIDDFVGMTDQLSHRFSKLILPMIHFSGGDPLLRDDFYPILSYAQKKKIKLAILGNPTYITLDTAKKLKKHGVEKYQISLDGLEEKHDFLRKKGSFKQSLKAIDILKAAEIKTHVMFSLSKTNEDDFLLLMDLLIAKKIDKLAFARVASVGKAKDLDSSFSPREFRDFLLKVHNLHIKAKKKNLQTELVLKDHLWVLLRHELGLIRINPDSMKIEGGCGIGINFLVVLADGVVYACRRFPSPIGKIPEEKLLDIFLYSKQLNFYRQFQNFKKCSKCELINYCRGCPAVAYGKTGSSFSADPQCWKDL